MGVRTNEGSGVDMSYNGPQVALYRPPSRGAVPYRSWTDYASCDSLPAQWFEISDDLMVRPGEAPDEQHDLIAKGLRVCNDCPVRKSCLSDSSEDDRKWTTRGGIPPDYLFSGPDRTALKPKKEIFTRGKTCKRSHDRWARRPDGKVFCYSCKQLTDAEREGRRVRPARNRHPKVVD